MRISRQLLLASAIAVYLLSCGSSPETEIDKVASNAAAVPKGEPFPLTAPLGLPPVPIPTDNPPTADTIAAGEKLFFSPILSVDESLSCSSCHSPKLGFSDGRAVSHGINSGKGNRNAQTLWNTAYNTTLFWDGRAESLEAQASGPMFSAIEMGHSPAGVEKRVAADAEIRELLDKAFGPGPVTMDRITKALAAYERTLLTGNSPFDRYFYGGEKDALSVAARHGLEVFRNPQKGNCAVCHTIQEKYALFTDQQFHNLGAGMNAQGELTDPGRYEVTGRDRDRNAFRTPTLRNIAQTAPYMHDGSLRTLKDVVDFYVSGGNMNPHLDPLLKPLPHLTRQDREGLVVFLESLTGRPAERTETAE